MNQFLLFLHFVGLVLGSGPGVASFVAMQVAGKAPSAEAAGLRRLPPILSRVSAFGLLLLWVTGGVMVWTVYGGPGNLPAAFGSKFAFVLVLTVVFGIMQIRFRQVRKGNMSKAGQLPVLGMAASIASLFAVLFAVFAFSP